GDISILNSLVGSRGGDRVGFSVRKLSNGKYVVISPNWDNGVVVDVGAVTLTSGTAGPVTSTNSLVGSTANDHVGSGGVNEVSNGNCVVSRPNWDNGTVVEAGGVTWVNGTNGQTVNTSNTVSTANSLFGTTNSDSVGSFGVIALSNGNFVVRSPIWDNG